MSSGDRPDFAALGELERVLGHVSEELAAWRRRALTAEAQRSELGAAHDAVATRERILALEAENADLARRLDAARARLADLVSRLQFLEEQVAMEEPAP